MKKFWIFLLSLVCCLSLAACASTANNTTKKTTAEISLVDREITVYVGETYNFKPTGAKSFEYSSSDESVATVSDEGLLTALKDGTAFIDVSAGKQSLTCKVNVIKAENYIRLNSTEITASAGSDVTLKAEVISGGKVTDNEVTFDKGSASGVNVTASGVNEATVSLVATGNYVITAAYGSMKAECNIKAVNLSAETLAVPSISAENCVTVKWNAVDHASGYAYSVNGGEWMKTTETSFNAESVTNNLKYKDEAIFAVKALAGETDYDYIDGLPASVEFSHEYQSTVIEEYTCVKAGKVKFRCSVCDKEYTDENYLDDHNMVDGACSVCGMQQTKKVAYRYDEKNDCYFVVGADAGFDSEDLYILAKYDDGEHGERPVKYMGYGAFAANKTIKRVFLPESMTEFVDKDNRYNKTNKNGVMVSSPLRGTVFDNCTNLEFVSMKGVTVLRDVADASYSHWNFRDCYNLTQVIVHEDFDNYGATFMRWVNTPDNAADKTDIYVYGKKITKLCNDSYPIGYDLGWGNNTLLTGEVFYYDETDEGCYKWHFAADGITVVTGGKHVYNNKNKCKKCGAMNDFGVNYGYYEGEDLDGNQVKTYYVSDNNTLNLTDVVILDEYTDGIHGTHPVTFVKNGAFAGNPTIKRVTLPESVTRLDGGVFQLCENLEYVSMVGITDMIFKNLTNKIFYGEGVVSNNNFLDCYGLTTIIVNKNFNLYTESNAQQFLARDTSKSSRLDIYSVGTYEESAINASPNGSNNMLSGIIFYKGNLDVCRRWIDDDGVIETSARDHDFVDGVCTVCGEKNAAGVIYQYSATYGVYYVSGYSGNGETVRVFGRWNDGKNGEADVKYIAGGAFRNKTEIRRVILDDNIVSLEGSVFWGCSNLEYVEMKGVTNLDYASPYSGSGRNNNFRECFKLKIIVVSNAFTTNVGQFGCGASDTRNEQILDFYVFGESGAPVLNTDMADWNNLPSGNVYYYSETEKSGCWHYVDGAATLWA